jgi:hypothetical protein
MLLHCTKCETSVAHVVCQECYSKLLKAQRFIEICLEFCREDCSKKFPCSEEDCVVYLLKEFMEE